jgi:replicative DNA helicase
MVAQFHNVNNQVPCNIESEESIIGGILLDPNAIDRIADILEPEAFYIPAHKQIYKTALKLRDRGDRVDLMSVTLHLHNHSQLDAIGGTARLATILNRTVSAVNIDRFAQLVRSAHLKRKVIEYANQTLQLSYDKTIDEVYYFQELKDLTAKIKDCEAILNGEDPDRIFVANLVSKVRNIEINVLEPDLKYYKLHRLANKHGFTMKFLENLYMKSLISDEYEQSCSFSEFSAKYGNDVREWLLHGFIPKGTTILLHAMGGVGKTMLAYYLVSLLATGRPWGNCHVTAQQRNALIFQTDESRGDSIDKAANLFQGVPRVKISSRWTVDHMPQLRKEIEAHKAEIVVIDSLSSISRNSFYSENETEYARPILMLRDIAQEMGCTVILIHHSNKNGQTRGTSAIFNAVSEVWNLSRPSEGSKANCTERILSIEKSRSRRPEDCLIKFVPETGEWIYMGNKDDEDTRSPVKDKIVDFLANNRNKRFDTKSLHELLYEPFNTVRTNCYQLYEEGIINRVRIDGSNVYSYFIALEQMNQSEDRGDRIIQIDRRSISTPISCSDQYSKQNSNAYTENNSETSTKGTDRPIDKKTFFSDRKKSSFLSIDRSVPPPKK